MAQRRRDVRRVRVVPRFRVDPIKALIAGIAGLSVLLAGASTLAWSASATTAHVRTAAGTVVLPAPTLTIAPAPTPASKPASAARAKAKKKHRLTLAELRAEVKRVDDDLARRTADVEQANAVLKSSTARLASVQAAATSARAEATRAHEDLGRFAAAAYRGGQVPSDVVVLMAPSADATDTLRGLQSLEQTGLAKTDIATYARDVAARATTLETQARELAEANAAAARVLEDKRNEVRALAASTQKQLEAEVKRVAKVKARKLEADCKAKAALAQEFPNGMIPPAVLCSIDPTHLLRGDAAVTFKRMSAAYAKRFDAPICITSAYRTRALQAKLFAADPVMVAVPGRSFHGLGLATDLCGGIQRFGSPQHRWMLKHAPAFGWYHPTWAEPTGVTPEPWHWEYGTPR